MENLGYFKTIHLVTIAHLERTKFVNFLRFCLCFVIFQPLILRWVNKRFKHLDNTAPKWAHFIYSVKGNYRHEGWVWFKCGKFYIRDVYACPDLSVFKGYSKKHLFLWRI